MLLLSNCLRDECAGGFLTVYLQAHGVFFLTGKLICAKM